MATATVKNFEGTILDTVDMPDTPIMAMASLLRSGYEFVSSEGNEITLINTSHETSRFIIFKD